MTLRQSSRRSAMAAERARAERSVMSCKVGSGIRLATELAGGRKERQPGPAEWDAPAEGGGNRTALCRHHRFLKTACPFASPAVIHFLPFRMRGGVTVMLTTLALLISLMPGVELAAADLEVDVELVLAVDVSGCMDIEEAQVQRAGYVDALRHPDFINAV